MKRERRPALIGAARAWRARCWRCAWLIGVMFAGCVAPAVSAQTASEAQIKAAYLISFMKYVDWPGNPSSMNICLSGRDTLSSLLESYEGRSVAGRPLTIRRVTNADQLANCHQLFIADGDPARTAEILQQAMKLPLLITGDGEHFIERGGAIALARSDGRVVFDINTDAIARAGLKAATPMLRLARSLSGTQR